MPNGSIVLLARVSDPGERQRGDKQRNDLWRLEDFQRRETSILNVGICFYYLHLLIQHQIVAQSFYCNDTVYTIFMYIL